MFFLYRSSPLKAIPSSPFRGYFYRLLNRYGTDDRPVPY